MISYESKLTGTLGDHDVLASFTHARLDGERYRITAKRGLHMAEPVSRLKCSFKKILVAADRCQT